MNLILAYNIIIYILYSRKNIFQRWYKYCVQGSKIALVCYNSSSSISYSMTSGYCILQMVLNIFFAWCQQFLHSIGRFFNDSTIAKVKGQICLLKMKSTLTKLHLNYLSFFYDLIRYVTAKGRF